MPPTPAFPIPVTYAAPTMPPLTRPSAQPTARSDDDDSEDNAANRRLLVMSLVLSGIFSVIMIVIVGQSARKLFAATPLEVPPQYFAIPGFILLFLPVPYALYHLFRIMISVSWTSREAVLSSGCRSHTGFISFTWAEYIRNIGVLKM